MPKKIEKIDEGLNLYKKDYNVIFELSPDIVLILDAKGIVQKVSNHQLITWLGYTKKEIIGTQILNLNFLPDESKRIIGKNFIKRKKGYKIPPYEVRFISKKGKDLWVRIAAKTIKGKRKNIIGLFVTLTDLTSQREKEKWKTILSKSFTESPNSMVLVEYVNKKPKIINVNKKFTEFYGYTLKEAIGKNPSVLKSGLHDKSFYTQAWKKILNPKIGKYSEEIINKKKNGKLINVILSINTIFNSKNEPEYFIANHTNITKLKKIEEKIRENTIQLEKMNEFFLNREERIIKLKEQVKKLMKAKK